MVQRFLQRCNRVLAESSGVAASEMTERFGDVAWRGRAGTSDLIAVFEITGGWFRCSKFEDLTLQRVSKLPTNEFSEVAHHGAVHRGTWRANCERGTETLECAFARNPNAVFSLRTLERFLAQNPRVVFHSEP